MKILIFLSLLIYSVCFAQWHDISPEPQGFSINDIAPLEVDIYLDHALLLACDDGKILKAHFFHWTTKIDTVQSELINDLNSIEIYNNRNVIVGGDNILLYSDDTLNSYQEILLPESSVIRNISINPENNSYLYLVGDNGFYGKSEDGGINWRFDTLSSSHLNKIKMVNDSLLFIVGDRGLLFRSTDKGESWEKRDSPTEHDCRDIKILSSGEGFLASKSIYQTTDFGENWELFDDAPAADSIYISIKYNFPNFATFYEANHNYVDYYYGSIRTGKIPGHGIINGADYFTGFGEGSFYFGAVNLLGKRYSTNPFEQLAMLDNGPFNQLQFLDEQTGFVAGWTGFYTEDGGESWTEIKFPDNTQWFDINIHFVDTHSGYSLISDYLYKTTDRGDTWENLGYFRNAGLLHFYNEKTGFVVCDTVLFKTDDFGESWNQIYLPHFEYSSFFASKMVFTSQSTGFLFGSGGFYYKTTDAGESWDKIYGGITNNNDASAADESNIICVGLENNLPDPYAYSGVVYVSHDEGNTWFQKKNDAGKIYLGVFADENGNCLISRNDKKIYYSDDYGDTWSEKDYPFSGSIYGFEFDHNEGLFAFDRYSSMIYHNPNLGFSVTNIGTEKEKIEFSFELNQNYPNPFNPKTNINFTLSESGKVKLTVYNLLGQLVDIVVNADLPAGDHTAVFDGNNLASGIYFYRLETAEYTATKKMILMK